MPSVCNYGCVPLSHLGVVTCVMGVETATGFINRCHYRSFLRQTLRKLGRIKMTSTCLWNPTRRLRTNKQCFEHDFLAGKISTLTENMERCAWCTELLINLLKYQHPLFFSLSAHLGQEDMTRYLVPYCRVDAYNFAFSPSDIRLWKSLPTETVSVQSLESFKILIMDWCLKHGCFNQF